MGFTVNQELACTSRGGARLVAAAAGSGKTTVLVERLMRRVLEDEQTNINDFLVITFTRAAAGELRSRIFKKLNELIESDPGNAHLRRQPELCLRADIGTIDSVCGKYLRENAHLAGIAPDFKVVDADRADAILASCLEKKMEELYQDIEQHPGRKALVDYYGAGRNDKKLSDLLEHLYKTIQSHPDPDVWLDGQKKNLALADTEDAGQTVWGSYLLSEIASEADFWAEKLSDTLRGMGEPGHEVLYVNYGPTLHETVAGLKKVSAAAGEGWNAVCAALPVQFPTAGRKKTDDDFAGEVKALRTECKEIFGYVRDKRNWVSLFAAPGQALLEDLRGAVPATEELLNLTAELDRAYAAEKKRLGVVDFSDQEHMMLRLLRRSENHLAETLSARYKEVLVDEFQDVNACQNELFRYLSGGGQKLFIVGDVKQSVYRFRLADPGIFTEYYNSWPDAGGPFDETRPGRILLQENFRSRPDVIDSVNHVFRSLMTPELGELAYDSDAELRCGQAGKFPAGPGGQTELVVISEPGEEEDDAPDKTMQEAEYIAGRIRGFVDSGELVTVKDGVRPADWGDFAILLRSNKKVTPIYAQALAAQGIPSVSQQGGGFFRAAEVSVLLSFLAVVDNPRQDVPLIALLSSPLYSFTPDELAAVRTASAGDYFTCLGKAAGCDERCRQFLQELESWRNLAPDLSVEALLQRLCREKRVSALLSAMPDGEIRRENLQQLLDLAAQFEADGLRGIFRFLQWVKRLEESGREPRTGVSDEKRAVQIISIHHSKGLEYPVVFLAGTGKRFNTENEKSAVLIHKELGIGAKVTDAKRGITYPSLAWNALSRRLKTENLSEELRVLYVAMTRAQDRLIITGRLDKAEEKLQELALHRESPLPAAVLRRDGTMLSWLLRAAQLPGSPLKLQVIPAERPADVRTADGGTPASEAVTASPAAAEFDREYPFRAAENLPSKLTASALKDLLQDEEALPLDVQPHERKKPRLPELGGRTKPLTGTARGIAVHSVLQFMDFAKSGSPEEIRGEIARLRAEERISKEQAEAVVPEKILEFFQSDIGRRVLHADEVKRELRFSLLVDSGEFYPDCPGEEILLQGVVDCCIREGDALTVIDYKTDSVSPEQLAARAETYRGQVKAYALAMQRLFDLPVKETVLYFLSCGQSVAL